MAGLSDYVPVNLISMLILGALWLRRLVRMDGHHWTRVVILTGLFWAPTIYLVLLCCSLLSPPYQHSCVTALDDPPVFCITE